MRVLLKRGADPNLGSGVLVLSLLNRRFEIAHLLLDHRADPNYAPRWGGARALFYAVVEGNLALAERLIQLSADVNHNAMSARAQP